MMDRVQAAQQLRRAMQLFAAKLSEEQALEVAAIFDPWTRNRAYEGGEFVAYGTNSVGDPQLYKVLQSHTSQGDWTPELAASLYTPVGLDASGYPLWSQPAGAHDAYNAGDVVCYDGTLYYSLIDGNVYSPLDYPQGWAVYEADNKEDS